MPELPDLEVISEFLRPRLEGQVVARVEALRPIVVRDLTGRGLDDAVIGQPIAALWRRGKFCAVELGPGAGYLAFNPMLAGRFHYQPVEKRPPGYAAAVLRLANGAALFYADAKLMGKLYRVDDLEQVPGWAEMGPDALDPALTEELFALRIRPYRGEIKGVLARQPFVAGIGNAYSDEICWQARLYPFRKRSSLSAQELAALYVAMRDVLGNAIDTLRRRMGDAIHVEIRDFLAVHGKGGQPCPRCGSRISQLKGQEYYANYCRTCQPGTLVRQ